MSYLREALVEVAETTAKLSRQSRRAYQNPYTRLEWPAVLHPEQHWFTSPEYASVYGTSVWDRLDQRSQRRVAFYEAAGFYSANIHGEKSLMQGLAARLYRSDLVDVADYLHHFLDEENKHSIYFGGFCNRYARVYRSRQISFGGPDRGDVDDFLFFAKTLVFEQLVDHYNLVQARDPRLHPLARFINETHHLDEARHLAFGRQLVAALWRRCASTWRQPAIDDVRAELAQFLVASWREFYNPDVYADASLADPYELAELAWHAPAQRAHRRHASRACLRFLSATGILTEEPSGVF